MSSNGPPAADQRSRARQRVSMTSMQAAKQSEDEASSSSSSQPLDLGYQWNTGRKGMLVSWDDEVQLLPLWQLLLLRFVLLALAGTTIHLLLQKEKPVPPSLLMTVLMMAVVLLLNFERLNSWFRKDGLVLLLVVVLVMLPHMIPFLWKEVLRHMFTRLWWNVMLLAVMLLSVLPQTLERVLDFWRSRMHGAHEWVLDSGAWIHHTSKLELLELDGDDFQFLVELDGGDFQFLEMHNEDAPSSGADAATHVKGRGSVRTGSFDFPGVHYVVGDDTRNVVSVSQLARDHGLVTVFEPTSCHVKEKKTGKIVGKGRLRNGMYMLDSLRVVGQYIGHGGASRGDRQNASDSGGGGRGHEARGNGEGDSTAEGHGGGGDGRQGEGSTGARNQEEGSGSGTTGGDVNETNEGGDEREIEEMNENDEYGINEIGEINGEGEKEDDEKRGGHNFGQLSSQPYTGLFGLSQFGCILWIVCICILLIAACMLPPYTILWAVVAIVTVGSLFRATIGDRESTEEETRGPYLQELSHQEHNIQLFGLSSRFDVTIHQSGYPLSTSSFASWTNAAGRPEEFFLDSGASFHTTWKETILFPYPQHLQNHTKPPTLSLGGIAAGSIAVTRSGYLNDKIMLDGVLLAPEAQANLVSLGQLTNQYNVAVEFDAVEFVIKKKLDGVQVGGGKILNHHYVLQYFWPGCTIFAHLHTPHPNIFGRCRPGPA